MIDEVIALTTRELESELENLLRRSATGEGAGGVVLGRAAEFLTSQRGVSH